MLKHYGLAAAFALWACASTAMAQPLSKPSDDSRLDRLERRLLEIETQNRQDLIARD